MGVPLRGRRFFYFHVSGPKIEEEVFARILVPRIHGLLIREVEFEFYRFVFRVRSTRYRISACEGVGREIRSVYEKYCGVGGSARRSRVVAGFRYPKLRCVTARKSGNRHDSVILGVSKHRCRQVRISVRTARARDRSRFRE